MKTSLRLLALTGAVLVLSVTGASMAFAHATYKSSNPPDKGRVSSPPAEITAEFTEPMTGGSYMDVTDPCGRDVGSNSSQTGSSMRVQNSGTAAGRYVVFWRAASIDGHTTEGEFEFTSTGGEPCPGDEEKAGPEGGGGGSGGGGNTSEERSDPSSGDEGTTLAQDSPSGGDGKDGGHSKDRHAKHERSKRNKEKEDRERGGVGPVAQGRDGGGPDTPSALDGIPRDGLLITLAVSALIGAAAGKIYVSLSGDDS